ncbi:MAG TPA: ACT domain-containing protein [Candidatus Dormibacteraeota bacterium]|nr:ACT domain-containing protein [Candidatus Dormibacteraeota bacterium]
MAEAKQVTFSRKAKQLSINCEDRPGTLSRVAKLLGKWDVNIVAMSCAPLGVQGTIHIVVDNLEPAKNVLDREHISYTEQDVLHVEMENLPGSLGGFAEKMAEQNINITTAYGSAVKGCRKATVIFKVSDLDGAARIRY